MFEGIPYNLISPSIYKYFTDLKLYSQNNNRFSCSRYQKNISFVMDFIVNLKKMMYFANHIIMF